MNTTKDRQDKDTKILLIILWVFYPVNFIIVMPSLLWSLGFCH